MCSSSYRKAHRRSKLAPFCARMRVQICTHTYHFRTELGNMFAVVAVATLAFPRLRDECTPWWHAQMYAHVSLPRTPARVRTRLF